MLTLAERTTFIVMQNQISIGRSTLAYFSIHAYSSTSTKSVPPRLHKVLPPPIRYFSFLPQLCLPKLVPQAILLQVFQQFDRREKVVKIDVVVLVLQRASGVASLPVYTCSTCLLGPKPWFISLKLHGLSCMQQNSAR